jgi:hypothetical protein
MPYPLQEKYTLQISLQPKHTPYLGPWLLPPPPGTKPSTANDTAQQLLAQLIGNIRPQGMIVWPLHPDAPPALAWHQAGWQVRTRYTYRIQLAEHSDDQRWEALQPQARQHIRKAERELVMVEASEDLVAYWQLHMATWLRQNRQPPMAAPMFRALDNVYKARGQRTILLARGADGKPHAGLYLLHDAHSTYLHAAGQDPQLRDSAAGDLLLWHAIRLAAAQGSQYFDCEGSMIPSIAQQYRRFGAEAAPYLVVSQASNALFRTLMNWRGW